jgi:hypothetical protein
MIPGMGYLVLAVTGATSVDPFVVVVTLERRVIPEVKGSGKNGYDVLLRVKFSVRSRSQ